MFPCTIRQLASIIDGAFVDPVAADVLLSGAAIDSRHVQRGQAFFALPGTRSHGLLYASDAEHRGAACVVADQELLDNWPDSSLPSIRVADAAAALQKFANWNRRQSAARVIGITGSVGKTTTRQMIAAVLSSWFSCIQSPRNFNNELGVPLSLLAIGPEHEYAVLELGAARPGDIRSLAELAQPTWGVVTRVAAVHLESMGSMTGIRCAKQELVESIDSGGHVFLNADCAEVVSMQAAVRCSVTLFGTDATAEVRGVDIQHENGWSSLTVDGQRFAWHGGRHLATSALAAIAVGLAAGIDSSAIVTALSTFEPDAGRGQIVMTQPWCVIDESYNASPESVVAAIQTLCDQARAGRRILVLGDMLELGAASAELHHAVGKLIGRSQIDRTFLVGTHVAHVRDGAIATGSPDKHVTHYDESEALQNALLSLLQPGDVVLVKGSRGLRMERIVEALLAADTRPIP